MKKLLLLVIATVAAISGYGQDAIANGDKFFDEGRYEDAKRQYELHKMNGNDRLGYADTRIGQCDECMRLLPVADFLFSENKYAARAHYERILVINPNDPVAKTRLSQIPTDGVEINGVVWATHNVGNRGQFVTYPQEPGGFFTYQEAQNACPAGWRPPTSRELDNLRSVSSEWVELLDIEGRKFGVDDKSIFIPAAGILDEKGHLSNPNLVYFWVLGSPPVAVGRNGVWTQNVTMVIDDGDLDITPGVTLVRQYKLPIRCVHR